MNLLDFLGSLDKRVEQLVRDQEVESSNLSAPILLLQGVTSV